MQPILLKHVATPQNTSFKVWRNGHPYQHNPWHFHPESEITFIEKGKGTRFVGDSIQPYDDHDLVFIGANLPHEWRSDIEHKKHPDDYSQSMAIHFMREFPGEKFYEIPELTGLQHLYENASMGLKVNDTSTKIEVHRRMENMVGLENLERILNLFAILNLIDQAPGNETLASMGFVASFHRNDDYRINSIYKFVIANFKESITLNQVADIANMTPNAFCRYFKRCTNKAFIEYLNETRVGYACKLLIEKRFNVTQIAYESGFRNLSNFNKQFKVVTGKTPSEYSRQFTYD